MDLTPWTKVLIIFAAATVVIIVLVLTVCVVSRGCCINVCLRDKKQKPKKLKRSTYNEHSHKDEATAERIPLHIDLSSKNVKRSGAAVEEKTVEPTTLVWEQQHQQLAKRTTDSTYSSMSTCSRDEQPSSPSMHSEIHEIQEENQLLSNGRSSLSNSQNYGQVTFSICYTIADGQTDGQLLICLTEAQDLPSKQYNGACDPYVNVQVIKRKGSRSKSKKAVTLYEFQTNSMKKTQHPIYKQTFMAELQKKDLQDCILRIQAYDNDKFVNDTELAETEFVIKKINLMENEEPQIHTIDLGEPKQDNGEILFGMNYLPTAERLSFHIVKTSNVKVQNIPDLEAFTPYVRVLLIHNGKLIKRKKTSAQQGTLSPSFEEILAFDVPTKELENVSFTVAVCHRTAQSPESESDFSSAEGTSSLHHNKDKFIGKVVIGKKSGSNERLHWFSMLQSPRKQLTQWHTLR